MTDITLGQTIDGSLIRTDTNNPERLGSFSDDYTLTGVSNWQQVQVNMDSNAINSYLQLVNAFTGKVIPDNRSITNSNSLTFTVVPGVNYAIRATSLDANRTGNYTIKTSSLGTASSVISIDNSLSSGIGTVDPLGNFAPISIVATEKWEDIALSSNSQIFGIRLFSNDLYKIDPQSNSTSLVGNININKDIRWNSLEFAPNNLLYGLGYLSSGLGGDFDFGLYTIDTATAQASLVAKFDPKLDIDNLTFDPKRNQFIATGTLFPSSSSSFLSESESSLIKDSLFSISLTGNITKIIDLDLDKTSTGARGVSNIRGVYFDESNTLFGFNTFDNSVFDRKQRVVINPVMGSVTPDRGLTFPAGFFNLGVTGGASIPSATRTTTPPTPTPTVPEPTPPTPTPTVPETTPPTPTPTVPEPTPPTPIPTVPTQTLPTPTSTLTLPPNQIPQPNSSGEVDLAPLKLKVVNGQFTFNDKTNRYEASGTIQIGRKDGTFPLITIQQGKVEYDSNIVSVDGIVSSFIGPNSVKTNPLFKGKLEIDVKTATASFEEDKTFANQFKIAGLDIDFNSLSLNSNAIALGALFKLPSNAGGASVVLNKPDGVLITPTEVKLGTSQKFSLPNIGNNFLLANLFQVNASNLSIEYVAPEDKLKLQGKLSVQQFANFLDKKPSSVTLDLSGEDNFIQIKDGKTELKGELLFSNIKLIPNVLEITKGKITTNTANQDLRGEANILLFPVKNKVELIAGLGFKSQPPPTVLSLLTIGVDKINKPLGNTGLFIQRLSGRYELAKSDPTVPEFTIGAGLTGGPEIPITLPPGLGGSFDGSLVNIDADYTANPNGLRGKGKLTVIDDKIASIEGTNTLDWKTGFYEVAGNLSAIDGAIKAQTNVKLTSNLDFNVNGNGSLSVPNFFPIIGGKQFGSADFLFKFTNNGNQSDDFAAGWVTKTERPFGIETKVTAGFRVFFDGKTEWLTRELPKTSSFTITPGTKWLVMGADWENANSNVPVQVKAPNGTIFNESDFAATGKIAIANEFSDSKTKAVIVLNPEPGIWDLKLANPSGLGNIQYKAFRDSEAPTIQVTAPSTDVTGQNITINYNVSDGDSTAKVSLFYDNDNQGFDGILIKDGLDEKDGAGNFVWNTQGIATGDYYVYAMAMDENNAPVFSYSPQPIKVTESADLSVIKTADRDTATPGTNITYTVAVTNNGTDNAKGAILTETLPEGAKFVSANVTPTKQSGNELTFDLGDLPKGQISTVNITVTAPTSGNITSTSSVTSKTFDPDISNDADFATNTFANDGTTPATGSTSPIPTPTPTRPPLRQVLGTPDNDNLSGIDVPDEMFGFAGNDTLTGLGSADYIFGGQGNDIILGGAGSDRLKGNEGDDTLSGDLGRDILIGGPGRDTFVLPTNAAVTGDTLPDAILDFQLGEDKIGLTEGLTEANLLLNFEQGNTLIKVGGTNQILGVVVGASPSQLSGSFVPINLGAF